MTTFACLALLAVTSFGLGRLGLWRVKFARAAEEFVFSSALGMAVLSYAAMLLGAVGLMAPIVVALLFVISCIGSSPVFVRFVTKIRWRTIRLDFLATVCLAVLVAAALLNGAVATNPILEVDAYEYHLTVPKAWLMEGRLFPISYHLQSSYHLLADMINVVALSLSQNDVVLCKLIQWYSGVLLAVATWCFGRRYFSARVAWVAAALTYMVKEISWVSGDGYVDLTVGLYVWLGIFALVRAAHHRGWRWHVLAGLFFGCGFAAKQSVAMFLVMAYVAYAAVLLFDRHRRAQLRLWPARAILAGAVAMLVASPWMIKNFAYTGDPFFPLMIRSFNVPPEFAEPAAGFTGFYAGLGRYLVWDRQSWPQLLRAAKNFQNNVMYTGANVLVVWLLASGAILIVFRCRSTLALRLLIAVGVVAAPWFAWVTSRFLFGFFPIYLLVLIQTLRLATGRHRAPFALLSIVLLFFYARTLVNYDFYGHPVARLDYTGGPILSTSARRQWLVRNNYAYPMIQQVNRLLTQDDRLLACGGSEAMPWLDVRFLPNPHTLSMNLLLLLWDRFEDSTKMRRWLSQQGITHVLLAESSADEINGQSGFVREHLERVFSERSLLLYRLKHEKGESKSEK